MKVLISALFLIVSMGCTKSENAQTEPTGAAPTAAAVAPASAPAAVASAAPTVAATPAAGTMAPDLTTDAEGLSKATAVFKTSKGTIKFKFYPKEAPKTVARFVELANSKFFNGLAFHRVVPGFVVQTGDPKSTNRADPSVGSGGSGQKLKAEFNNRKHVRGTVAMARSSDVNSADSQFYICLSSFPHLDGKYTVFGQVVNYGEKVNDKDALDRIVEWDKVEQITFE